MILKFIKIPHMKIKYLVAGILAFLALGYSGTYAQDNDVSKVYRATPTKINALVHTKLDVSFDYAKRYLYGKAWITLKPYFYDTDSLTLDAKGMDIKEVALVGAKTNTPLKYTYDNEQLFVRLNKKYAKDEKYTLFISYTAKPDELKAKGSVAITDAKGLYFINPDGTDKNKPVQIWTQGETESSSAWFPTIDKPNQKTTAEISMTVPSKYVTLSNGKLIAQKANTNGTRTDTWKMDLPHAPYLFMMAVGDFKITKDSWKGKEVSYYLESKYAPYAKQIFGKTPKMIEFFSNKLGIDYPWNKYSQIVVRDYVSGAMENTTATLHGAQVQRTARELLDGDEEGTIAHELFHQWFGDYVTAESWSNLTVNESFATIAEILWKGHDAGKDAEDEIRYEKLNTYLQSAKNGESPVLARYYYNDKEDMFDNVSYAKGSIILYALKNQMGDDAFFKGLNLYLRNNAFKTGEPHQLRLAFEEVTGKDWSPYFNQWYFNGGHPILDVKYDYTGGKITFHVKQIQSDKVQTFILPLKVDLYVGGSKIRKEMLVDAREQSFSFDVKAKPDLIDLDPDKILVGEIKQDKTLAEYVFQYKNAPSYANRIEALKAAARSSEKEAINLLITGLQDQNNDLRALAVSALKLNDETVKQLAAAKIIQLAKTDKSSAVREKAILTLAKSKDQSYLPLAKEALKDQSYKVIGAAVTAINAYEPATINTVINDLDEDTRLHIPIQATQVYASLGDDTYADYFVKVYDESNINRLASLIGSYMGYVAKNKNTQIVAKVTNSFVKNMDRTTLTKYVGAQMVGGFQNLEKAKMAAAEKETNGELKAELLKQAAIFKDAAEKMSKKN